MFTSKFFGQVAIVTGAGSGIGMETAKLLAAQGASVVLSGRTSEKLEAVKAKILTESPQAAVLSVVADVSSAEGCEKLVEQTIKTFERVDILVNNAGIATKAALLTEVPADEIDKTIDINLKGAIYMMQAVLRQWMVPNQTGAIINVNSIAGKTAYPYWAVYDASKFGLRAITEAVAEEQKLNNIKVMGIYPGATNTAIWEQIDLDSDPNKTGMVDPITVAEAIVYMLGMPAKVIMPELGIEPLKPAL